MVARPTAICLLSILSVVAVSAAEVRAADASFDGKTLKAWMTPGGKPVTRGWEVVDGAIHLRTDGPRGGAIVSRREFTNFDLTFEFKIAKGGNSGVKHRVRKYGKRSLGFEYQIIDDAGYSKRLSPRKLTGSLYDLYAPNKQKTLKPVGEYNSARIVVRGNKVEHWLNGKKIVSAVIGNADWKKRLAKSKFAEHKNFGLNPKGRIMLTDHRSEVWYRNFKMEPLDDK